MKDRLKENSLCSSETVLQASNDERFMDFCNIGGRDRKPSAALEVDPRQYL